jgi:hypothetical protein
MTDAKTNNLRKMGGVAVLLAVLAISDSAFAISLTISNTTSDAIITGTKYWSKFPE